MRISDRITLILEALGPISRRLFLQGAAATAGAAALPAVRPEVAAMREIHGMVDAYNHAGSAAEYIASAQGKGIVHQALQNIAGALSPEQHAMNLQHLQHLAGHMGRFKEVFPHLAQHPALLHLTPHATDAAGVVDHFGQTFNGLDPQGQLRMAERAQGFLQNPGWNHELERQIRTNPELMNRYMDVSRGYHQAMQNIQADQWRQQDAERAARRERGEIDDDDPDFDRDYEAYEKGKPRFGRVKNRTLPSGQVVKYRERK